MSSPLAELRKFANLEFLLEHRGVILRTTVYLISQFLQRAAGLILLPLLLAVMTADQFSRYGLLSTVFLLLGAIFTLNVHTAPSRLIFDCKTPEEISNLLFSSLIGTLVLILLWSMISLFGLQLAGVQDPVSQGSLIIQILIILALIALRSMEFGTLLMLVEGKAVLFATTAIVRQGGLLLFFVIIVQLLDDAFNAFLLAFVLSAVAAMGVSLGYVQKRVRQGRFTWDWFRQSLFYAAPSSVHLIAIWLIQFSGRWIGTVYMSLEDLASFTLMTQIVLVITMFSRAFFNSRAPEIGQAFGDNQIDQGMTVINSTVLITIPILVMGYVALYILFYVLQLDLLTAYRPTRLVFFFAFWVNIFDLVYLRGIQTLAGLKKNEKQAMATVVSGLFIIVISFPLAAQLRDLGLVIAMTAGYLMLAMLSNIMAQRQITRAKLALASTEVNVFPG